MTHILQSEAERFLSTIFERFAHNVRNARFPLQDSGSCRAFAQIVTEAVGALWHSNSTLPPTALILATIRLCQTLSDPSSTGMGISTPHLGIPRPFAHEMLERLQCELPPTYEFALDQVGRIVNEAGTLTHETIRRAFLAHRARHQGALWAAELDAMVGEIWNQRYRRHPGLAQDAPLRRAA